MAKLIHDTVVQILGPIDDLRVAEIIGTGASEAELVEAKRWVAGYKRTLGDDEDLRPSVVDHLCEILRTEDPEWFDQ